MAVTDQGPTREAPNNRPRLYDRELLSIRDALNPVDFADVTGHRRATVAAFADRERGSDDVVTIEDIWAGRGAEALRLRVYRPREITGGMLWCHGGAFTVGAPEMDDDFCRDVALRHQLLVVSPDYRLAPEHRFPAAEVDCRTATEWLACQPELSGSQVVPRLLIAGASAGGALAVRTALWAIANGRALDRVVLAYPVVDPWPTDSMREYSTAPIFDARQAALMWQRYLGSEGLATWPSLMDDDRLHMLPMTLVITTEHDPLRDSGLDFVRALLSSRVSVQSLHVAGAFHAYDRFAPDSQLARQFRQYVDEFIARSAPVEAEW